jgi:hypothetical protein
MPRGHCTLPADEAGRILDRLAGLEQVIHPEAIRQALAATGRVSKRACLLTYEVIFWVVLAMGLLTDLPIRQVFKHARRLREGEESPARSNLCMARRRLGVAPVRHLFSWVVRALARPDTPGSFYHGFRLMGIDATVLDVYDSPANAAAFGRPTAGPSWSAKADDPSIVQVTVEPSQIAHFGVPIATGEREAGRVRFC